MMQIINVTLLLIILVLLWPSNPDNAIVIKFETMPDKSLRMKEMINNTDRSLEVTIRDRWTGEISEKIRSFKAVSIDP